MDMPDPRVPDLLRQAKRPVSALGKWLAGGGARRQHGGPSRFPVPVIFGHFLLAAAGTAAAGTAAAGTAAAGTAADARPGAAACTASR